MVLRNSDFWISDAKVGDIVAPICYSVYVCDFNLPIHCCPTPSMNTRPVVGTLGLQAGAHVHMISYMAVLFL